MKIQNLAFFLIAALPGLAQSTTPVTCSTATLTGLRSIVVNGRDVSSTAAVSKSFSSLGLANFDGAGNVTFNLTTNTNQSAGAPQTWTGTYSLASNCVGSLNIASGDSAAFILIPYNSGRNFTITGQDATYGFSGSGGYPPAACVTASVSGSYAFTGTGYSLNSGSIAGVNTISGILQFDGAGAVSGNWSVATAGSAAANSVTGKYTVNQQCTATATLTDGNNIPYSISMVATTEDGSNLAVNIASQNATFNGNAHSTFTNPGAAVELAAGSGLSIPPGSLFSIYGFNLSTGKGQATKFPLPTTLASAVVTVNGEQVPLYSADDTALGKEGLINAQMPLDVLPGVATVVVKNGNAVSNSVAITIPATPVPGVFIYGNNHSVAQNFPDYSLNTSSNPAAAGSTVIVYFTGGGAVSNQNQLKSGGQTPYPPVFNISSTVTATIAGADAPVQSAVLVPTTVGGFYQAAITVPKVAAGDRTLILNVGGVASNATTISVK